MPQFDLFSFSHQVYWFIFIFLTLYFFISYLFLPKINRNIKFRQKKINYHLNNYSFFFFEKNYQNQTIYKFYNFFFLFFIDSFQKNKKQFIINKKNNEKISFQNQKFLKKLNSFISSFLLIK